MALVESTEPQLDCLRVDVVEAGRQPRAGRIACEIDKDVELKPSQLISYCYAGWEPAVFDALLVAAAIEFCDRSLKRSAIWGRRFELRIPVHNPARWQRAEVLAALHDALATLTGDRWEITFTRRHTAVPPIQQGSMGFKDPALVFLPFSDGMDSRAVATIVSAEIEGRLMMVRLGRKQIDRPKRHGRRLPFTTVPFTVPGDRFPESSCRSRGFKFAMVSALAAFLYGASRIIVPESGQGALGPVLVPLYLHADCRTHPVFLRKMEVLVAAVLDHTVRFEFPRLWFTKGETLKRSIEVGDEGAWLKTRSCWQKQRQMSLDGHLRQCGFCAACMLRRMSVHAASAVEPTGTYMLENLDAETLAAGIAPGFRKLGDLQERYAVSGPMHLDLLANFLNSRSNAPALRRHIMELSEALSLPQTDVEAKLRALLQRHEAEWKAFLASLSPTSFIRKGSALAA